MTLGLLMWHFDFHETFVLFLMTHLSIYDSWNSTYYIYNIFQNYIIIFHIIMWWQHDKSLTLMTWTHGELYTKFFEKWWHHHYIFNICKKYCIVVAFYPSNGPEKSWSHYESLWSSRSIIPFHYYNKVPLWLLSSRCFIFSFFSLMKRKNYPKNLLLYHDSWKFADCGLIVHKGETDAF